MQIHTIYTNIFKYIQIYSNIFKYIQIYSNIFKYIQIQILVNIIISSNCMKYESLHGKAYIASLLGKSAFRGKN